MSNTDIKPNPDIKIFDSHKPALTDGYYNVEVTQTLNLKKELKETDAAFTYTPNSQKLTIKVAGEQYSLSPQLIDSVFPPSRAHGDFTNILPHIVLNRSTLPWERKIFSENSDTPWLALLLFTEDELVADASLLIADQISNPGFATLNVNPNLMNIEWTPGSLVKNTDDNIEPIQLLLVGDELWNRIKPADGSAEPTGASEEKLLNEITYLANVRGENGLEKAVIIGGRMPSKDKKNIVHLVSMENLCDGYGKYIGNLKNRSSLHGFASLYSWEFFCNDHFIITPEVRKVKFPTPTKENPKPVFEDYIMSKFENDLMTICQALNDIEGYEYFSSEDF
ncbi:MAG TPA: hypothetical protein VGB43_04760, partial [Flavobacterium sp.]